MAVNKDVQDFFELRAGFQGMLDFAAAAIAFMDNQGIAMRVKKTRGPGLHNGNGHAGKDIDVLREQVKAKFANRRHTMKKPAKSPIADGKHVTAMEAAKMMKCSDANIRLMWTDGRLPKPTFETRPWSKDEPNRPKQVQVVPVEAVKAAIEQRKANA